MVKRLVIISASLVIAAVVIGGVAAWIALSSWLPTNGKALLKREIERRAPVECSIGSLRYDPWQGFRLEDVRVVGRATREPWCAIPKLDLQLDWAALIFRRRLALGGRAPVTLPLQTLLSVSAEYGLRDHALLFDLKTADVPVRSFTAPLVRFVPPPLTDGRLRLQLHIAHLSRGPPAILVRMEGTRLVWTTPSWNLTGDVLLEGTAAPPLDGAGWTLHGNVSVRRGVLQGLPAIGTIADLEGEGRFTSERIDIATLTGMALGSPWALNGTVQMGPHASVEGLLTSHAALAPLAAAFPALAQGWQPEGSAEVRAVCRGPLQPSLTLDCLAHADIRQARVSGTLLTQPLTDITGSLDYDLVSRRLSMGTLTGQLNNEPFTVSGEVRVTDPSRIGLHVTGTLPLDMVLRWLPEPSPISRLEGAAALNIVVSGSAGALQYVGDVRLQDAAAQWTTPAVTINALNGLARLSADGIGIPEASLTLNDQPMTLTAAVSSFKTPRILATARFPTGRLELAGRVTPADVVVENATLVLEKSRLAVHGTVAREANRPSTLALSGAVEFADLNHLPFLPLPQLNAWNVKGAAQLDAQFEGSLSDWPSATLQSRLRADALSVRDIPLEQVTLTVEQSGGVLRARIPSALCAGGKCWGELIVERRPAEPQRTYVLQADVVGLQLDRLTAAIPAWRARAVTGNISAHALLSGTWEQQATWRGEGWLNASGERLGDLPLLEKVFRGLFGVLGERLGLDSLRRAHITQASVQWRLAQGRFLTDNLRLGGMSGTEPVAVYATGSVGLDRTLDFVIEPELSEGVVLQAPTTSTLAGTVLKAAGQLDRLRRLIGRHRLTGTLDKPEYRFEFTTKEILKETAPASGDLLRQLLERVR